MTNDTQPLPPLVGLLAGLRDAVGDSCSWPERPRLREIRPAHGCVFGNIDDRGTRLTGLAERSGLTKQSVGEAVADLERLGFVERVPTPPTAGPRSSGSHVRARRRGRLAEEIFAAIEARYAAQIGAERYAEFRETLVLLHGLTRASATPAARAT